MIERMKSKFAGLLGSVFLVSAMAIAIPQASAQTVQEKLDGLSKLSGAERLKFLEENAIKEGKIVVYAADDPNVMRVWQEKFKEKYPGIDVQYVRMNTKDMLQRVASESAAGRPVASILGGITPTELAYLKSQGILASYVSPEAADFDPAFKDANGFFTAHWYAPEVIGYNTTAVKKEDVPTSLEALASSNLNSKLGRLESGGRWLAGNSKAVGNDAALDFAKRIAEKKPQLFNSNSALTNALTSGQIAVAFDMHAGNIGIAKSRGAPVDYMISEPLLLLPAYTVVLKDAPNPYAAALNYDWRLSKEAQSLYTDFYQNGPRKDVDYPFQDLIASAKTVVPLSPDVVENIEQFDKTFRDTFVTK